MLTSFVCWQMRILQSGLENINELCAWLDVWVRARHSFLSLSTLLFVSAEQTVYGCIHECLCTLSPAHYCRLMNQYGDTDDGTEGGKSTRAKKGAEERPQGETNESVEWRPRGYTNSTEIFHN